MPRTALGRARLARCDDFVSRPLDFQYYHRVLKFHIPGARFRDRRIWRDRSATEAGGRCRIATPSPWSHSTCATNAGLTAWVAWVALVANEASGRRLRVDPQTSPGKGEGVAAGAQRVEIGVCNANLNPMHAVYNAPHLPDRPRADSSRLGGGAPRGRFGLRAWAARALRNLGGPGRPGAAIRRSDASMQFTKLRSGSTRPPLRALLKPTTPTSNTNASANAEAVREHLVACGAAPGTTRYKSP